MQRAKLSELMKILKGVSRSFYLSIRILRKPLRAPIGIAYLLARISDTIADTDLVSADIRIKVLNDFDAAVANERTNLDIEPELQSVNSDPKEKHLLNQISRILHFYTFMANEEKHEIKEVLKVVISGQILDLQRFDIEPKLIRALKDDEELDDYTWRVAGVVGKFWNTICKQKNVFDSEEQAKEMELIAIDYGKGLQLVNILRDLPGDLKNNRCYLPKKQLNTVGLKEDDLLDSSNWGSLKSIYMPLVDQAEKYLISGWRYVNRIPERNRLLRLACVWPVLIGLETLTGLRHSNPLSPEGKIKVNRGWVYKMMRSSVLVFLIPGRLSSLPVKLLSDSSQLNRVISP